MICSTASSQRPQLAQPVGVPPEQARVQVLVRVVADQVPLVVHPPHEVGPLLGVPADDEERGAHAGVAQVVQHAVGRAGQRTVVEGERQAGGGRSSAGQDRAPHRARRPRHAVRAGGEERRHARRRDGGDGE
jgi:hypothetical protein